MSGNSGDTGGKCPVMHGAPTAAAGGTTNRDWWPNQLNLKVLHQHPSTGDPMGEDFDYAAAFKTVDLDALKNCLLYTSPSPRD